MTGGRHQSLGHKTDMIWVESETLRQTHTHTTGLETCERLQGDPQKEFASSLCPEPRLDPLPLAKPFKPLHVKP